MSETQFKPKRSELGLDVTYEAKGFDNDPWAQKMLREVGSTMKVAGHEYKGSFAVHIYISEMGRDMAFLNQFSEGDVSEQVMLTAYQNLGIELAKRFGHKHSTRDKKDKR